MNNNATVSVIVPVYNMEKYVDECLNSLIKQTYNNIEIIVVDDGSKDSSYEICKKYADQYSNILLKHKENGGGGSARNLALDITSGDYVAFVDSDDWVIPETFERMMDLANKYDADIVRCEVFKDIERRKDPSSSSVTVFNRPSILENMLNDRLRSGALKMIKRSIIGATRFPLDSSIDDMVFFSGIIEKLNTMVYTDAEYYYYRYDRVDSMSNSTKRFVRNVYERFIEYTERYNMTLRLGVYGEEAFSKAIEHGIVFFDHYEVAEKWEKERAIVLDYFKANKSKIMDSNHIPWKYKLKIRILTSCEPAYKALTHVLRLIH